MTRDVVIGLDVSKKRIGAGIVDYQTGACIHAAIWHTSLPGQELAQRCEAISVYAHDLAGMNVIAVFLEDTFLMRHTGMVDSIVAIGNVEALAATHWPDRLIDRIKPSAWRKTLNLQARGKDDPLFYAREHFHTDTGTHLADHLNVKPTRAKSSGEQDAADAICIAKAGRELLWRGGVE